MWKSFHLCFPSSLIKPPSSSPSGTATTVDSDDPNHPSILLINNFNLLYDDFSAIHRRLSKRLMDIVPSSSTTTTNTNTTFTASTSTATNSCSSSASSNESQNYVFAPEDDSPPPDLTAVYASRRFFFSSPGRSNSITDSPDLRSCHNNQDTVTATASTTSSLLTRGTAVKQYVQSPDPYNDFRRSMQEMLDAGYTLNAGDPRRYEFLHELLLSYLSLNAEDTHKFILRAFADILVSLLSDGNRTC